MASSIARVVLGCMRLDAHADATIDAAIRAGIRRFDSARAYGPSARDAGTNEAWVARARLAGDDAWISTKCGMRREADAWIADGRARTLLEDAQASAAALGGPPDLLLLHAPDPKTALATSIRAMATAMARGLTKAIGVSNVTRAQLEEARGIAPISAVQLPLGAYADAALRGGVVAYCILQGIDVMAYAPFGGPDRTARLASDAVLKRIAEKHGVGALDVLLAYLLAVHPSISPVVGARRPETIGHIAAAASLELDGDDLARLDARFSSFGELRAPRPAPPPSADREVVIVMGMIGAGKSQTARAWEAKGYERLNRDTLGGTLRGIAKRLDARLAAGATRLVLDNTYPERAARHDVVRVARAHGARVRCVHLTTGIEDAQVNAVGRILQRFGRLLSPEELVARAKEDPSAIAPGALFRFARTFEPPGDDEGFAEIDRVPFVREHPAELGAAALVIALDALPEEARARPSVAHLAPFFDRAAPGAACLLVGWRPSMKEADRADLAAAAAAIGAVTGRLVEALVCDHPAGPPVCWCRPPLPGLWLSFAHRHGADPRASAMIAASAADRTMARAVGIRLLT